MNLMDPIFNESTSILGRLPKQASFCLSAFRRMTAKATTTLEAVMEELNLTAHSLPISKAL
jgi:hypothetical protein